MLKCVGINIKSENMLADTRTHFKAISLQTCVLYLYIVFAAAPNSAWFFGVIYLWIIF